MIRCKVQSTGLVRPLSHAILNGALLCLLLVAGVAGCATISVEHAENVELRAIIANPDVYDGKFMRTEACVSVAVEGMYLLECGTRYPIIAFSADKSVESKQAVENLIAFGHSMMGEAPEKIRIEVEGVYRHSRGRSRFDHTIELRGFRESRGHEKAN